MNNKWLKIFLIEDRPSEVELIEELLAEVIPNQFEITPVKRIKDSYQYLPQNKFDVILLDLSLPDSQGLASLVQIKQQASTVPIVVLTSLDDENIALEAVRQGAQDYLLKGQLEGELLVRAIRYAMERQRTEEALRQRAERERLMGRMLERIRQSLELNEILQTTVSEVQQFLKTDSVVIYRCNSNQVDSVIAEAIDSSLEPEFFNFKQPISPAEAIKAVEAVLTVPIWQSEPKFQNPFPSDGASSDRELQLQNHLWGQLVVNHYSSLRQWQEWEIDFLNQLASQVGIAIQQSELYQKLEEANQELRKLATIDGLTKVANRLRFEAVLQKEWHRLAREQKPLSLIMCDIDFFKDYNDLYGHIAGDVCLQRVAQAIKQASKRPADLVARYGGEEFAAILPDTDASGAFIVAQNIQRDVKELQIPHRGSKVSEYVSLSLGISTVMPSSDRDPIIAVKTADRALYDAKRSGRNQIVRS